MSCRHQLAAYDLIPVVSWLWLRGKCRYCKAHIPDSPFVELAVPALFVLSYLQWPEPLTTGPAIFAFAVWLIFLVGFVALAVYDLKWYLLPDKIVFPLTGLALLQVAVLYVWTGDWRSLAWSLATGLVLSGLFLLLFIVSQGKWIGFGDVKLAIALGILAGTPLRGMLLLFVASFIGTLLIIPLALKGKARRHTQLPFGPLLIAGAIVVVLWGQVIVDRYVSLLSV